MQRTHAALSLLITSARGLKPFKFKFQTFVDEHQGFQSAAQISIARGYDFIYLRLYPLGHEKLLPEIPQDEARFSRAVDQLMSFRGDLV